MKNCQVPLEELTFNKNKSRKDGLNTICRVCSRLRSRQYYKDNTVEHKKAVQKRNVKYKQAVSTRVYEYLLNNPCTVCGEKDITVLEFDHLRDKTKAVSQLVMSNNNWERVWEEIKKCQVLCANCHRRKTAKDQNWFVIKFLKMRE